MRDLLRTFTAYARATGGAAAMELALIVVLATVPVLNAIDMATYAFDEMQTHNAAEMAAESAYNDCGLPSYLPATTTCTATNSQWSITFSNAVSHGIQETTLGNLVSLNSDSEGYYCATTSNTIVAVSNTATSCSGDADSNATPGDYVLITATYTYRPIFKGVSVLTYLCPGGSCLITKTVYIRMD